MPQNSVKHICRFGQKSKSVEETTWRKTLPNIETVYKSLVRATAVFLTPRITLLKHDYRSNQATMLAPLDIIQRTFG
jgi:hypothetical protein